MKRIYLVRHGESEGNVSRLVGGKDFVLTVAGKKQADRLAERVSSLDIKKLVTSDFVRAQQTMQSISTKLNLKPEVVSAFGEKLDASSFFGLPDDDPLLLEIIRIGNEKITDVSYKFEDGENFFDIHERVNNARDFLEKEEAESILVVSHGFFLSYFVASLLLDAREPSKTVLDLALRLKLNNTAISYFQLDENNWKLVIWNDHAHFAE